MINLKQILSPLSVNDFLDQHWGKKALHIKGQASKFPELFGWNQVEKALNNNRPSYEGMSLIHDKKVLPSQEMKQIYPWLENGATLAVNSLQQMDENLSRVAAEFGKDLNTNININSYVSCPSKQGPDIHYDKHDVYIIQTEGKKKWYVYEPTFPKYPLEVQANIRKDIPKQTYLECELEKGDVLYIPRGHWHHALAVTPSIHLSLGPEARTGIDLINWLKNQLMETDEFFRRDFPIVNAIELGGDRQDQALEEYLNEFRRRVQETVNRKGFMDTLLHYVMQSNPVRRRYQMPRLWEFKNSLTPQTRLILYPAQKAIIRHDDQAKRVIVMARGHLLSFREIPESLLKWLFSRQESFCGEDLLAISPGIEWDRLKTILTNLYEMGLLLLPGENSTC
jgi:ribosomal protein L16 Arg81 hydroxylase